MHGPSLTLRYPTPDDARPLFELGSDSEVTQFFSWGPYTSQSEPASYIAELAQQRRRGERLEFLIIARGPSPAGARDRTPVGVTGLSEISRRDRRAVVGTWLGRAHWGTGVNREAKALIAYLAFEVLGLERLGAYANLDNPRSQAALERIGFVREGVLRRWHRHGAEVHDVIVWSWLKQEWQRSPLARQPVTVRGRPPSSFQALRPAAAPS